MGLVTRQSARMSNASQSESVTQRPSAEVSGHSEEAQSHCVRKKPPNDQQMDTETATWLKAFIDLRPPVFKGQLKVDPSVAKYWLENVRQLLKYIDYPKGNE